MATMFICSVNTIMFNANPLLRYDGYYVMADWLEIPNLRIKSTQFFGYLFQEQVLGLEIPVQSYLPRSRRYTPSRRATLSYGACCLATAAPTPADTATLIASSLG